MAGSILILRGTSSAYDFIGGMLGLVAQEMEALGQRVVSFSTDELGWSRRLADLLQQEPFDFALTMSGIGVAAAPPGKVLIWEAANVPLFNWNCDHPCYYPPRHGVRNRFVLHGYVFPDHAHYNIRHLNPNGMAFAVHIGMPPRHLFPGAPLPLSERNGRIIFSKSGRDPNVIEADWRKRMPLFRDILFAAGEELLHRSTADFVPVLQRIAEQYGVLLNGNSELTLSLLQDLDSYVRFRRGDMVMHALLNHPVDVFGTGWDHVRRDGARAVFHGAIPWQAAAIERLPHYLGCLSVNPLVELSVHDRVFFALAAGVTPVSDGNAFARTLMPGLLPYSFDFTPERIAAAADALLADPAEAMARTEAAWQALSRDFAMRRAAVQIMQFATLQEANARCSA